MKMKREHRHVFSCIITERKAKQNREQRTEMNTHREMLRQKIERSRPERKQNREQRTENRDEHE